MKLLIDAGNTRIKWALADGSEADRGNWLRSGVLPVEQAGGLSQQFTGLEGIRQVWVSNVAGEEIAQHIRNAGTGLSAQPRFIIAQEAAVRRAQRLFQPFPAGQRPLGGFDRGMASGARDMPGGEQRHGHYG